jgi:hypothetical protein
MKKPWGSVLLGTVVAAALTGCTAAPSPFDGARDEPDELPAVASSVLEGADPATSRYQGQVDGYNLYLVDGEGPIGFCLVYTDGTAEHSGSSCSGGDWLETTVEAGPSFRIQLKGFTDRPGNGEADLSRWVRRLAIGTAPSAGE